MTGGTSPVAAGESAAVADHHMRVDRVSSRPKQVLIVVANPTTSTTLGWPVGFWGAELTHPYYELAQRGVGVTIASPEGGKVEMDSLSDPRDDSKWSADDLIRMGFLNTPELVSLLQDTPKLKDLDLDVYDAIMVAAVKHRCSASATTRTYTTPFAASTSPRDQ